MTSGRSKMLATRNFRDWHAIIGEVTWSSELTFNATPSPTVNFYNCQLQLTLLCLSHTIPVLPPSATSHSVMVADSLCLKVHRAVVTNGETSHDTYSAVETKSLSSPPHSSSCSRVRDSPVDWRPITTHWTINTPVSSLHQLTASQTAKHRQWRCLQWCNASAIK